VVRAEAGRPDQAIGTTDEHQLLGNHLVLDLGGSRSMLMAHLKPGSLRVRAGEPVRAGPPVAACGSSGNTSEPHLHLQVQNRADFNAPNLLTFPLLFRNVTRMRDGRAEFRPAADLRRNDHVITGEQPRNSPAVPASQ
jgi:murein DD-endopeptidase MepM/ murein hydrolase activator NlpD